jgi:glycosyltransferase involved in cell wall biosynthesis
MSDASMSELEMQRSLNEGSEVIKAPPAARVLLLGPSRSAVSGVSTHLNQLFGSPLSKRFQLTQFQVGSEGRAESRIRTLLRLAGSPFAFAFCLIRLRPRIVHINTSLEPKGYWRDLVYLLVAKALRRRVIYQVHGGALPADFFAGRHLQSALLRQVLSWPDRVVLLALSEMRAYAAFAPHARLVHIANAIASDEADLRIERYSAGRPLRVVYAGRLVANKGVFDTLEAVRILRTRDVPVELKIAGTGPATAELARRIRSAGLEDRVRLLGGVFGQAKQQFWHEGDVFAFPTYHHEGLPYALLEAMAAGAVPVVAAAGAIPDVMHPHVHGLLVPPRSPQALADALQTLDADRALLHRMAVAGRARIEEHYSISRLARDFEALYTELER